MHCIKNVVEIDRLIRFVLAEIFVILGFFWLVPMLAIAAYGIAIILFITGASGFCPLYTLFKIDTVQNKQWLSSKIFYSAAIILLITLALLGSYYSNFFTKKFFIEDYNAMNNYYKQTLFFTGQGDRNASQHNYQMLVTEYSHFESRYLSYHPYTISKDVAFNDDLKNVEAIISNLKETISTGDLKLAHTTLEQIRPIFQDILKRNNFSMLAIALVDFHDAMEKIIAGADSKDSAQIMRDYPEVSDKLKTVEAEANDTEIQTIRQKLDEVRNIAQTGNGDALSSKVAEMKSAFVKVYLKRG